MTLDLVLVTAGFAKSALIKRFGPLLVAIAGALLVALELLRARTEGVSVFWVIVGGFAMVLGLVGHFQRT